MENTEVNLAMKRLMEAILTRDEGWAEQAFYSLFKTMNDTGESPECLDVAKEVYGQ